jgi:hypothetical protein
MPFFALRAGQKTSPRPLLAILKEAHDDLVKAAQKDRQTREESGAPIDGDALSEPSPWVDRPELADVRVSFRAVSHETYLEAVLRVSEAYKQISTDNRGDLKSMLAGSASLQSAMADFVSRAVATVDGLEDEAGPYTLGSDKGLSLADVQTLQGCGLLGDLYAASKRYQELDAEGKKHCGLHQQRTLVISSAPDAQASGGPCEAATVEHPGGAVQTTSTTHAQEDILYVTGGYQRPSISTTALAKEEAGWTA